MGCTVSALPQAQWLTVFSTRRTFAANVVYQLQQSAKTMPRIERFAVLRSVIDHLVEQPDYGTSIVSWESNRRSDVCLQIDDAFQHGILKSDLDHLECRVYVPRINVPSCQGHQTPASPLAINTACLTSDHVVNMLAGGCSKMRISRWRYLV